MGKPVVKLVQGARSLDLNDQARYWLAQDFTPPETAITPMFAGDAGDVFDRTESNRAFSFTVAITGSSAGQIDGAVRAIKTMLARAGQSEPLYLVYNASDTVPDPLWGQFGAALRYEVAYGTVALADGYMVGVRRATDLNVRIAVTIKPYALGKQQLLASALGGVLEDKLGTVDGRSRGLSVPEATTNLHINPVFGNATYDTGWTTGSNLVKTQVTDAAFLPFGFSGVRLSTASTTNNHFTESITLTAASYRLSYYVVAPDRSALSATQVQVSYDGVAQSSTYTSLGNGLYVVEASVTGTAAAHTCGIVVKQYATVILVGAQCELKTYRTPLSHGDLMGCAWASTAHASTSTRTAARVSVTTPGLLGAAPFTVRAVWKSGSNVANGMIILDARDGSHANGLKVDITATPQFRVAYSGSSVSSGVLVSTYTTYILHAVWNGSTITLYVNGATIGSSTAISALSEQGAALFVGTDYSTANHAGGTFGGVAIFNVALSATQVANDYANAAAVVADGARVESVPWLWTKDGDNVVDNCNDSTHDNWCVVGGVGGTSPARTVISMQLGDYLSSVGPIALSLLDVREFSNTVNAALMADSDGTVDAGSCGGSYESLSVSTTDTAPDDLIRAYFRDLAGKAFVLVARIKNAGSGLSMKGDLAIANMVTATAWKSIPNNAAYRLFYTDELRVPDDTPAQTGLTNATKRMTIDVAFKRATGTANVDIDFTHLLVRPLALISYINPTTTAGVMLIGNKVYTLDEPVIGTASSPTDFYEYGKLTGDPIEFLPERMNVLTSFIGLNSSINPALASAIYYQRVMIEPRYDLI